MDILIPGFEQILKYDFSSESIIVIKGKAGALKSALSFSLMSNYLSTRNKFGVYLTLEQSWESHIKNMNSIGIQLSDRLLVSDFNHLRKEIKPDVQFFEVLDGIKSILVRFKEEMKDNFSFFVLDSLNALYSLSSFKNSRLEIFDFFIFLRKLGLISLIIKEIIKEKDTTTEGSNESYLSDGIIEVGTLELRENVTRYIQLVKMRGCSHSLNKFQLDVKDGNLIVLGPIYR